jgi:hypothetical protein
MPGWAALGWAALGWAALGWALLRRLAGGRVVAGVRVVAGGPGAVAGRGHGAGTDAEGQIQERPGAELVHCAGQPGGLQLAGVSGDALVGSQCLGRGQIPPAQRRGARVLAP